MRLSHSLSLVSLLILIFRLSPSHQKDNKAGKKKDVRDYTDADFERLYDQWEEDEEELPEDEKPDHLKVRNNVIRPTPRPVRKPPFLVYVCVRACVCVRA